MAGKLPRDRDADYTHEMAGQRRQFITAETGVPLEHVGHYSVDPAVLPGNIESFSGVIQVPMGFAGPLSVKGEHIDGEVFVPMATSEGHSSRNAAERHRSPPTSFENVLRPSVPPSLREETHPHPPPPSSLLLLLPPSLRADNPNDNGAPPRSVYHDLVRHLLFIAALSGCAAAPPCPGNAADDGPSLPATLVRVVDGDTIVVALPEEPDARIRLRGIDCPEPSHNAKCRRDGDCEEDIPLGKKATAMLEEIAPAGAEVRLVSGAEKMERDRWGRRIAYVERGDVDLGLEMVKSGLCVDFSDRYPHPRAESYLDAAP